MTARILIFAFLINFACFSCVFASAPKITAKGAILIEAKTGRVIYEKNADTRLMPASTTKIMTAILALENLRLTDEARVSREAMYTEAQNMPLDQNDIVSVENLLRALLLESDNGSAVVLAEHMSGSVKKFSRLMNKKAVEIGCENTNFVTPNGLPNEKHLSTARDMAKISAYAMKNQKFREIVGEKNLNMFWVFPKHKMAPLENTNRLLWTFDGITGIKTGWTNAAGGCLAASAKRRGLELIVVVLGSEDADLRFKEAAELLEYGFSKVKLHKGPMKEDLKRTAWVKGGQNHIITAEPVEDVFYPIIEGDDPKNYSLRCEIPKIVNAPMKKGDKVGELIIMYNNKQVGKVDMVSKTDAAEGFSFLSYFFVGLMYYFGVR